MSAVCEAVHIPLDRAYLCADCHSVSNNSRQCPACASQALLSLATVLDRQTPDTAGLHAAVWELEQALTQ